MPIPLCHECKAQFTTNEALISHLTLAACSAKSYYCYGCPRFYPSINSFRKHIRKEHSNFNTVNINITTSSDEIPLTNAPNDECFPQYSEFEGPPDPIANMDHTFVSEFDKTSSLATINTVTNTNVNLTFDDLLKADVEKYASYFYNLRDITRKRSFEILSSVTSFSSGNAHYSLENDIIKRFKVLGESDENIQNLRQKFDRLRNPLESVNLNSEYRLRKHFQQNGTLILPEQIVIGERDDFKKISGSDGPPVLVKVKVTIEFIRLRHVLKKFFELPNVFQETMQYIEILEKEDEVISNFIQAEFWKGLKQDIMMDPNKIVFPLIMYFDDYEPNNPLGGRAGLHKCGAVYIIIPCLPPSYVSKLDNIFLFVLFNSADRKDLGNEAIFEEAIKELQFLEKNGIDVNGTHVYFCLALLTGDNLGLHSLLGFTESFSANYFCRICHLRKSDIQKIFHERSCTLRNEQSYEEDLAKKDVSSTGVNRRCIFNDKFLSFHAVKNIYVDVMHDWLEGVLKYDLSLILTHYIRDLHLFSTSFLRDRLNAFNFDENDSRSRPTTTELNNMSASEILLFVRILPLLIGDYVDRDDEYWNLVILQRIITEIIFSKSVHKNMSPYLGSLIEEYLEILTTLFEDPLKPKHHFLVHYPQAQHLLGPLGNISSMRSEGKHQQGKRVAKVSTNRVNIQHSIAIKEQYVLNHRLINRSSGSSPVNFLAGGITSFNVQIDSKILVDNRIYSGKPFHEIKKVEILGSTISARSILVRCGPDNTEFEFFEVKNIYLNEDFKIVISGLILKCDFDYHFQSYEIIEEFPLLQLLKYEEIVECFNSYKIKLNSKYFILKKW